MNTALIKKNAFSSYFHKSKVTGNILHYTVVKMVHCIGTVIVQLKHDA